MICPFRRNALPEQFDANKNGRISTVAIGLKLILSSELLKKNAVVAQKYMRTIEKPLQDFNLHSFNIWYIALRF